MSINIRTRTEERARGTRRVSLVASDVIEIRKNGVVVEDFTVPNGKKAEGFVAVDFTITDQ